MASQIPKLARRIVPLYDRVLISRIKPQEKTATGILLPEKARESLNEGLVVAVGEGGLDKSGARIPVALKPGQRVLLPPFGGTEVKLGDETLLVMRDTEVLGIVEDN